VTTGDGRVYRYRAHATDAGDIVGAEITPA
jgi:hypothetical protein